MTPDRLVELQASNLGVIEQLSLVLGDGMTAITGETGAGKTLVLTAIDLLVGGRAESSMIGPHGSEAVVEGRFIHQGDEVIVQRVIPVDGRSRAYLNGRLATAASLAELGQETVELHGQHSHQALAGAAAQRAALDRFGKVNIAPLLDVRLRRSEVFRKLEALGGDDRERFRRADLLRFQVEEIDEARIADPDEDARLQKQETMLAEASAYREAAATASRLLGTEGPVDDALRQALMASQGREPLSDLASHVQALLGQLSDAAADARALSEQFGEDPQQLAEIQDRRRVLSDIRRKYGDALEDVLTYRAEIGDQLQELENHEAIAQQLQADLMDIEAEEAVVSAEIGAARRAAAPRLAKAITRHVRELALPSAQLEVQVGEDPGDDVTFLVTMNRGLPVQPLSKVASGGELARTMLAARRVLSGQAPTMIFDEVDAGVGGAAATAVGLALRKLGEDRQVLVVTHLPQVAAHGHHQVQVVKSERGKKVAVDAQVLLGDARVVELSRMLSGSPDSPSAREHAAELLSTSQAGS